MAIYDKPPLGVKPHWIAYRDRIDELNQAISRYLQQIPTLQNITVKCAYYRQISQWAKEIEQLSKLEAELEERGAE